MALGLGICAHEWEADMFHTNEAFPLSLPHDPPNEGTPCGSKGRQHALQETVHPILFLPPLRHAAPKVTYMQMTPPWPLAMQFARASEALPPHALMRQLHWPQSCGGPRLALACHLTTRTWRIFLLNGAGTGPSCTGTVPFCSMGRSVPASNSKLRRAAFITTEEILPTSPKFSASLLLFESWGSSPSSRHDGSPAPACIASFM